MSQNLPLCNCQLLNTNLHCPHHNPGASQSQFYPSVSGGQNLYLSSADPFLEPKTDGAVAADQPFVGFRNWQHECSHRTYRLTPFSPLRYVPNGVRLKSVGIGSNVPSPWNDPVAAASCRYSSPSPHHHTDKRSPVQACECGLYTWKRPDRIGPGGGGSIWGAVLIWGRVLEHDEGFRSEYAKIICLADNGNEITHYAAEERGLRIVPLDKVAIYAAEFGRLFTT